MQPAQAQKVLVYGTRAHPLSFFLTRSLNRRVTANNVFSMDTLETREENRHLPIREDRYNCKELPDLQHKDHLESVITENEITDVIDMTNTSCKVRTDDDEDEKLEVPKDVRLFTPIFTTPTNIREQKSCRSQLRSPIMPGIVYPF